MKITSKELKERGLVYMAQDIRTGTFYGRFGDEQFTLKHLNLDLDKPGPNRCVRLFEIPELSGRVASIEEIRQCAALQ